MAAFLPNPNPSGCSTDLPSVGVSRRQFLQGIAVGAARSLVPTGMMAPAFAAGDDSYSDGLLRCTPAEANVDSRAILDFIDSVAAHNLNLHSFMLYRHGRVCAEGWAWPYASFRPHIMHSLTKSVTACAVGLAIDDGHFALNDKVVSFFGDELPDEVSENLAALTVEDLLTMRAGHAESISGSVFRPIQTSWVREFFKIPVVNAPGSEFLYSSALSFMLSAIVTKTTGEAVRDYLQSRVFAPLGIVDLDWGASPGGISSGGNGLTWKTADSLKLGILHLNHGHWNGRQVIPQEWVAAATRPQVPGGFYGYHWWVVEEAGAYLAEGAFGQFSIVFPEHDAVLAMTAGIPRGTRFRSFIFDRFPGAFHGSGFAAPAAHSAALQDRIDNWRLLPRARHTTSPVARRVSGRTYDIEANDDNVTRVRLDFADDEVAYRLTDHRGEHLVRVGIGEWIESGTGITGNKLHHEYQSDDMRVVAHGCWWDDQTFEMTWQFVESAWVDHVMLRFHGDQISIDRRTNANYAPTVANTLRGTLSRA